MKIFFNKFSTGWKKLLIYIFQTLRYFSIINFIKIKDYIKELLRKRIGVLGQIHLDLRIN